MANPLGALGSVPIMQVIQDTLQRSADINRTNTQTQLLNQQSHMLAQDLDSKRKLSQSLQQLANAQQAKAASEAGQSTDMFGSFGTSVRGQPIVQGYQREMQQQNNYRQMASAALEANLPDTADYYNRLAGEADNRARQWYQDGIKFAEEDRKQIASIASTYDGTNAASIAEQIKAIDPSALRGVAFNRDPNNNAAILDGENTKKAYESIANRNMSRAEQLSAQREADRLKQEATRNNQIDARIFLEGQRLDQYIAASQAAAARGEAREQRAARKEAQDQATFGGEAGDLLAALTERGVTLPAGFRAKTQIKATLDGLLRRNPNLTPDEIADKIKAGQLDFKAESKEVTIAAGRAGQIQVAANEVDEFAKLVEASSKKVPRTQFVPFNKLQQMAQSSISSPELREFRVNMMALANAYDVLAARGGTDMEKRAENRKNFDTADSPEALKAALKALKDEAAGATRAAVKAMKPISAGGATGSSGKVVDWSELK